MSLPVPIFTVAPLSAPMATPLYSRLLAENRLIEDRAAAPAAFPWTTNIIPKQMSSDELSAGVRWLCNRLYRPVAFEQRLARFIDLFQPPAPRRNSRDGHSAPVRAVDVERVELARSVTRLGAEEAAMAARLEARLLRKPAALGHVLLAIGNYMQIRHIYHESGLWDAELGRQARPALAPHERTLPTVRPVGADV